MSLDPTSETSSSSLDVSELGDQSELSSSSTPDHSSKPSLSTEVSDFSFPLFLGIFEETFFSWLLKKNFKNN